MLGIFLKKRNVFSITLLSIFWGLFGKCANFGDYFYKIELFNLLMLHLAKLHTIRLTLRTAPLKCFVCPLLNAWGNITFVYLCVHRVALREPRGREGSHQTLCRPDPAAALPCSTGAAAHVTSPATSRACSTSATRRKDVLQTRSSCQTLDYIFFMIHTWFPKATLTHVICKLVTLHLTNDIKMLSPNTNSFCPVDNS